MPSISGGIFPLKGLNPVGRRRLRRRRGSRETTGERSSHRQEETSATYHVRGYKIESVNIRQVLAVNSLPESRPDTEHVVKSGSEVCPGINTAVPNPVFLLALPLLPSVFSPPICVVGPDGRPWKAGPIRQWKESRRIGESLRAVPDIAIEIDVFAFEPDRILRHKPSELPVVPPGPIVMKPRKRIVFPTSN